MNFKMENVFISDSPELMYRRAYSTQSTTEPESKPPATPALPEIIFGLIHTKHSVSRSQRVLKYYHKRVLRRERKSELLRKLVILEKEVPRAEAEAIKKFIENPDEWGMLPELVGKARGIKVEPRVKEEPEVKTEVKSGVKAGKENASWTSSFKECSVCTSSFGRNHFPNKQLTPSCNHEPNVCITCLTQSIETQIPDVIGDQVKCPECPATLPHDVVRAWASQELFERYIRYSSLNFSI